MVNTTLSWKILLLLLSRLRIANLQFHMFPIPQPMPQIFAIHPPPPIAVPVPIPVPIPIPQSTTTSTTTTTEQNVAIAIPFPMPLPIQIAVPAMPPPAFCQAKSRPVDCPPCPPCLCAPSCTPAFFSFCSPCHLKCRCNNQEDVPRPLPPTPPQPIMDQAFPMPVPLPAMVGPPPFVMPYPTQGKRSWRMDSSSEDTSSSSSSEWGMGRRKGRNNKRNRIRNSRRSYKVSDMEASDGELVKPVLTYVSKDGDVKLKQRISADEATQLLGEKDSVNKQHQRVRVMTGENYGKPQVLVVSDDGDAPTISHRRKQVVLRRGTYQHILGEGKKELLFRPPDDKIISNLSVSFQII